MRKNTGKVVYNSGLSILTVVGVVFIVLKFCGVQPIADWPWWLVTLPIWIQPLFAVTVLALLVAVFITALILSKK